MVFRGVDQPFGGGSSGLSVIAVSGEITQLFQLADDLFNVHRAQAHEVRADADRLSLAVEAHHQPAAPAAADHLPDRAA